ncbi:MAG TPA: BatD family protein [Bacillota bacterium]|nr:BatD family protein [Bacillota bacterium]
MTLMLSQPRIDVDSPVTPTATFDPPVIRPGESATYRVTFNALEASIEWPGKITATPRLELRAGGHGQIFQMGGTNLQPRTCFNYHARPGQLGQFTVPAFTVTVYGKPVTVPAARLEVVTTPPPGIPPVQQIILQISSTNLYVGQAVRARVLLPSSPAGMIQGLGQVQVNGPGVFADQSAVSQRIEMLPRSPGTPPVATFIYETTLTPIATGKLSAFAQAFTAGNRFSGPIVISGPAALANGLPQYTLLDSEPVELAVRPLPREGQLPGFTGAVGTFAVDAPTLSTNDLRVGEPVRLTVKVRGNGNLTRLVAPPPPRVRDWQVFAVTSDSLPPQVLQAQGFATFQYLLVPVSDQPQETPPIPFSCFDPQRGAYLDLTIPPVRVAIRPGAEPIDTQALLQANTAEEKTEKEPTLSGLSSSLGLTASSLVPLQQQTWFPLLQLAPAAAFLGLWGWDRRRRYFEQHPEVLLRRRARRALHRERRALHKAAQAGDAERFANKAVSALRVACAPHYPAEPRALVGHDVLELLPAAERSGRPGEVVRRFFAVTDATRFATASANTTELLALRPDLERVLEQLEERL